MNGLAESLKEENYVYITAALIPPNSVTVENTHTHLDRNGRVRTEFEIVVQGETRITLVVNSLSLARALLKGQEENGFGSPLAVTMLWTSHGWWLG